MRTVYLVSTGGTIEKVYQEQTGAVRNLLEKIDRYLSRLRLPDLRIRSVRVTNKDSLEMTETDRARLLKAVEKGLARSSPVVITHGTDTMIESSLYLKRRLPRLKVPVILTGAMTPLGFEGSDGLQNLTESLLAARILKAGVWVVMHNQVFPVDQVQQGSQTRAVRVEDSADERANSQMTQIDAAC